MARKRYETTEENPVDLAIDEAPESPAPESKPAPQKPVAPAAKQNLTLLQRAVVAIAAHRANDSYKLTNHLDFVQYRNSAGRLVASANKKVITINKTTGQYNTDTNGALALAKEVLARYKNFSESNVIASAQHDNVLVVVTIDGEKYKYDLTANALAS